MSHTTGKRTESGKLTEEFLRRLEQNQEELPEVLTNLARLQRNRIQETPEPGQKDIEELLQSLREHLGGAEAGRSVLVDTCGHEGALCNICPFGAFIPPEMGFASLRQPICLPFISVTKVDTA